MHFFMYTLISYHPRVYNMFHPRGSSLGSTSRSHPKVLRQGPTPGFQVLGPTPGSQSHFSGMLIAEMWNQDPVVGPRTQDP